jgi:hypothetical protein
VRECREKEDDHTECVLSFLKNHFEKAILIPRRVKVVDVFTKGTGQKFDPERMHMVSLYNETMWILSGSNRRRVNLRGSQFEGRVGVTRVTEK